jgi:hypothetical protein
LHVRGGSQGGEIPQDVHRQKEEVHRGLAAIRDAAARRVAATIPRSLV